MAISASGIRAGAAYVELYLQDGRFARGLQTAEKKLRAFSSSAREIGTVLTGFAGAAAVPIAMATRTFMGFEDQMKAVQAVTGAAGTAFDTLYDKAKELGRTTSFTAAEVAGGMLSLGRAGFSTNEIDAAIASMLNLARASGTDLAQSADIAANTLRSFNLEADQMTRVADVLVATANNSVQTVEDLGEAMKYAAASAADSNVSLEETAKAMGVMANFGIKGSMAGTSFRRMLLSLADPKVQKTLESMGVTVLDTFGNIRTDVGNVLAEIGQATANMPTGERLALFKEMFDLRGMSGALKMANADFPALIKAIDEAAGTAERTAKVMDSGLGGAFRRMMSAIEGVQIAIGEALSQAFGAAGDRIAVFAQRLADAINVNQELVGKVVVTIASIAAVGAGFLAAAAAIKVIAIAAGAITAVIGGVTVAVKALSAALLFLNANPMMLLASAAAMIAARFVNWQGVMLKIKQTVSGLVPSLEQLASTAAKSTSEINAEQQALKTKIDRLAALRPIANKTNEQLIEQAELVSELKAAFPGLSAEIDALGASSEATAAAMDALSAAMADAKVLESKKRLQDMRNELYRMETAATAAAQAEEQLSTPQFRGPAHDPAEKQRLYDVAAAGPSPAEIDLLRERIAAEERLLAEIERIAAGPSAAAPAASSGGFFSDLIGAAKGAGMDIGKGLMDGIALAMETNKKAVEQFLPDLQRAQAESIADPLQRDLAIAEVEWKKKIDDAKKKRTASFEDWAKAKGISTRGLEEADERRLRKQYETEVPALPTGVLEKARDQDFANIKERHARDQQQMEYDVSREQIAANKKGFAEQHALLELERQQALRQAEHEGRSVDNINRLYDAKQQQILEERAEKQESLDYEVARAEIEATKKGKNRDVALIELERKRALKDAAEQGLDLSQINKLYDFQRKQALHPSTTPRGTFSALAAMQMGGGESAAERTARHTEETAKGVKRLNDKAKHGGLVFV